MPAANPFESYLQEHQALVAEPPVAQDRLLASLDTLEQVGTQLTGANQLKVQRFAAVMHESFSKIVDLEVVPPLDEQQTVTIAGKVAIYGQMREATTPKTKKRQAKATASDEIPTDDVKA